MEEKYNEMDYTYYHHLFINELGQLQYRYIARFCVGDSFDIMDKKLYFEDVMTTKEVAERWGRSPVSIKQLCTGAQGRPPRLIVGEECRKSGGTWLITKQGIERLFGPEKEQ